MKAEYIGLEGLQSWAQDVMLRKPDFVIGNPERPYMRRWWVVPRNAWCNVYLHEILRSDDDRALHDHVGDNTSFIIEGEYDEVLPDNRVWPNLGTHTIRRAAGETVYRQADWPHRLEVPEGVERVLSLFIVGPKIREWGFHCPNGWVHWERFTAGAQGELVGAGCGE